jgi:hypothetical protein
MFEAKNKWDLGKNLELTARRVCSFKNQLNMGNDINLCFNATLKV